MPASPQDIAPPSQLEAAEQAEAELRKQNEDVKAKLDLKASQCSTLAVQLKSSQVCMHPWVSHTQLGADAAHGTENEFTASMLRCMPPQT